jgi:hypothetical protein
VEINTDGQSHEDYTEMAYKSKMKMGKNIGFCEACSKYYPDFKRCMDEVNYVCNTGYPPTNTKKGRCPTFEEKQEYNPYTRITNKIVNDTRKQIYKDLIKDNLNVDKRDLDNIFTAGLYQQTLVEGFEESKKKHEISLGKILFNMCIVITCLTFIAVLVGWDSTSLY